MNRNTKKGFTIVELIIVIAVIGILAAVLIPTFSGLIRKAMLASDEALVKNLNTALAADAENGTHATMTEALTAAKNFGFDVDKINAKVGGNEILWDSYNDCFVYLDEGEVTYIPDSKTKGDPADYQLWKIYDNVANIPTTNAQNYSIYLADNNATALNSTLAVGFDAGQNTKLTEVTYVGAGSAKEVVICTNSILTKLMVNAASDTVNHHGSVGECVILAVDGTNCYNEFGTARKITINEGKVVTKNGSVVKSISAEPSDGKNVTIDVTATSVATEVVVKAEYRNADGTIKSNIVVNGKAVDKIETETKADLSESVKKNYTANYYDKHPTGFVVDESAMTITINDKEALLYYGYVFNPKTTASHCPAHGGSFQCMWYNCASESSYANSKVNVLLNADIDFEGASFDKGIALWHKFNGQNHTIKNVIINNPIIDETAGLFKANNAQECDISNLKIDNVHVSAQSTGADKSSVGILTGATSGNITNIEISNSSVSGGKYTGGVVGYAYGSIVGCKLTSCTVSGQYKSGGVVGFVCSETKEGKDYKVNNNVLSAVTIEVNAENLIQGKTATIGKIVGHFNGSANTKGHCIGNTFTGTTKATKNIGLITTVNVEEN